MSEYQLQWQFKTPTQIKMSISRCRLSSEPNPTFTSGPYPRESSRYFLKDFFWCKEAIKGEKKVDEKEGGEE